MGGTWLALAAALLSFSIGDSSPVKVESLTLQIKKTRVASPIVQIPDIEFFAADGALIQCCKNATSDSNSPKDEGVSKVHIPSPLTCTAPTTTVSVRII